MASMKKAGIKAANKVKANKKEKDVPQMTQISGPTESPSVETCYGEWGGVTNSHSNGIKPKK